MANWIRSTSLLALTLAYAAISLASPVTRNGLGFELNGQPFAYSGTNVYDLGLRNDGGAYAQATTATAASEGYKVMRMWAFTEWDTAVYPDASPWGVYLQKWENGAGSVNYGDDGLGALDLAISAAEDNGLKVILTLVNNWADYGGMDVYVNNMMGSGSPHYMFFNEQAVMDAYKNYVNQIVSRYMWSDTVFAWELANEFACQGSVSVDNCPCTCTDVTQWADEMSSYIKSIDPNHMVTWGGGGGFNRPATANWVWEYDGGSGEDFDALVALDNIDFGTFHLYTDDSRDSGAPGQYYTLDWTTQFVLDHDNATQLAGKPTILEEYGYGCTRQDALANRQPFLDSWQNAVFESEALNGAMKWGDLDATECGDSQSASNVYAICQSDPDYGDLVVNFNAQMDAKSC